MNVDVEFEDENAIPPDQHLRRLARLSEAALGLEADIVRLTQELQNRIAMHRHVVEVDIPNAMDECGIKKFTLSNGQELKIKESYVSSKLVDSDALDWVEKNGGEDIVRATILVELPTSELETAKRIHAQLRKDPAANRFSKLVLERSVHHSTLGAFVRSAVDEGRDPPLEMLKTVYKRAAVIGKARTKPVDIKGLEFKE